MNLETKYLGMTLKNPLSTGSSPATDSVDEVKRLEDAGIGAIVLRSLFEEQIDQEEMAYQVHVEQQRGSYAEASGGFLPEINEFVFDTDHYLEHIHALKSAVQIPVIASLNGVSHGGWEMYATLLQQAGADALELNFYDLPTNPMESSADLEGRYLSIFRSIRKMVKIPLAVKLSPFFSSVPNFAHQLSEAGADGIVMFNRLYQPDIDIEHLSVRQSLHLSDSAELPLRLRWLAILEPQFKGSMAVSGGVHNAHDVIKSVMAGAHCTQMVSAILKHGAPHVSKVLKDLTRWLEEHEYPDLKTMRGSMSLRTCPDPAAFSRANYMKILLGWAPR